MEEVNLVDKASGLFESASGCRLRRDPNSKKCKLLQLGKWRKSLKQTDLPPSCHYLNLFDQQDMVAQATRTQPRKINVDTVQDKVSKDYGALANSCL